MEDCCFNQKDWMANSLAWAAENGHEGVVRMLLGQDDIEPDEQDEDGETPLLLAARNGHSGVVGMLLGRNDVNP